MKSLMDIIAQLSQEHSVNARTPRSRKELHATEGAVEVHRARRRSVLKLYRYGSFWLIKPKACTNQKVVRDTSCLTEIKASRSAFLVAKSAKSAKYRVFCGYTWKNPGIPG